MAEYVSPYTLKEGFTTPTSGPETNSSLLKSMLSEERANLDKLMDAAKRLNPVIQSVITVEDAYDAAFESDIEAPLPRAGATLQGFAVIFLIISYISLTLITTIAVMYATHNAKTAGKVFIGFVITGVVIYSLMVRLG
jgi:hypothetical protein